MKSAFSTLLVLVAAFALLSPGSAMAKSGKHPHKHAHKKAHHKGKGKKKKTAASESGAEGAGDAAPQTSGQ
ncbi:MAG: hypothetical protein EBX52_11090 [Proteobacteria bacterium]|nr:hypothetical protein [Pseudomonadota bacterium]